MKTLLLIPLILALSACSSLPDNWDKVALSPVEQATVLQTRQFTAQKQVLANPELADELFQVIQQGYDCITNKSELPGARKWWMVFVTRYSACRKQGEMAMKVICVKYTGAEPTSLSACVKTLKSSLWPF